MRRRDVLKSVLALGGGAALLGSIVARPRTGTADDVPAPGRTIASEWQDDSVRSLAIQSLDTDREIVSPVYRATHRFIAVGSSWDGEIAELAIRARGDTGDWTDWHPVGDHEAHVGREMRSTRNRGSLVFFLPSRLVQYRYLLRAGQPAVSVRLILIDSTDGPAAPDPGEELGEPAALTPQTVLMDRLRLSLWERGASAPPQTVISRAGWGADESYRFTATGIERWPRDYRVVQKVVVHHTDTSTGGNDPAAIVRAIYYYHAVTRGWDDIGYNFLIDWRGNIYEGRAGGRGVVGGHALGFNYGSLGIGCIGDYSVNRDPLPQTMKQSLARLIAWQGQYVNPHGSTYFVDGNYPNLCGHRDVNATTCPGDTLYAHLPGLRGDVLWNLDGRVPTPAGQITGVRFRPTTILSSVSAQSLNETIVVEVTVRNVGTGIMVTQQPAPGMLYQESESYKSRGYAEIREAWRVGVEISPPGPIGGMDHPYRWGLPDALEPGQSATIVGQVRLRERRSRQIWAGLVQELQAWTEAQAGMADIAIVAPRSTIFLPGVGS